MGVFDTLPADGCGMSAAELAEKLNVDEALLGLWRKAPIHLELTIQSSFDARGCAYILRRTKPRSLHPYAELVGLLAPSLESELQNDVRTSMSSKIS